MGVVHNRLTVAGPENTIQAFERSEWLGRLGGRHPELYERSESRAVWWFESRAASLRLGRLSADWPDLIFLLDYEEESKRLKGLIKAVRRKVDRCELSY